MIAIEANSSLDGAVERIMNEATSLISREGIGSITIRKIAKLADVNVAAVNYYFRSKNNVINQALERMNEEFHEIFRGLDEPCDDPKKKLLEFLIRFEETTRSNSLVFNGTMQQMMDRKEIPAEFIENIRSNYHRLTVLLGTITGIGNEETLSMLMFQLISVIAFPVLYGKHTESVIGLKMDDPEIRRKYIELLIREVLSAPCTEELWKQLE